MNDDILIMNPTMVELLGAYSLFTLDSLADITTKILLCFVATAVLTLATTICF